MVNVKFLVLRNDSGTEDKEVKWRTHEDRKQVIEDVLASQHLEAVGCVDTHINPETGEESPNEVAEVIIALGSAGVFTALASAFKHWLDRNKIAEVSVTRELTLSGATADDVIRIARELGLSSQGGTS